MAGLPMIIANGAVRRLDKQQLFGLALLGLDLLQDRTFKIARFVEKRMRATDRDVAQEMVDRMRRDVPVDRGDLYNGIRYWEDDGSFVVQASGVRLTKAGVANADHAGFVEHGTRAGERRRSVRYVADSNYHDLTAGLGFGGVRETGTLRSRRRLQYRGHPGTDAQPFFYDNARDVLAERAIAAEDVLGLATEDEDAN